MVERQLWRSVSESALGWLAGLVSDQGGTGFDVGGMPDSCWVLHSTYERLDDRPDSATSSGPHSTTEQSEEVNDRHGAVVSANLGTSGAATSGHSTPQWFQHPGPGFRRVLWRELAARYDVPLVLTGRWPGIQGALPIRRDELWERVEGPPEGSLDLESFTALIAVLTAVSPMGADTMCTAFYTPWAQRTEDHVFRGRLGDAMALVTQLGLSKNSPQNLWPDDHSWVVYSDWDLWATRVSGTPELMALLNSDPYLEVDPLPTVPSP